MSKTFIEFRKQRDFNSIFTDTFGFIRNEFKPFIKTVFNIAGPAIVIFMLSLAAYNYIAGDIMNFTGFNSGSGLNTSSPFAIFTALILYFLSAIAAYIFTVSSVLYYIKSYVDNKGAIDASEIKANVYQSFWSFLGLSFLKGATLFIAVLLCVVPVLYAMIPMAILFSVYVFEPRRSTTDAFSQSFTLANADFWTAFGAFIVLGIIYYVLGMVFSIPSVVYAMVSSGIFSGEVDPANLSSISADPILILLNVLNTFFQFLLNIILMVAGAVIYFHLHEKVNFTGTYDRISKIGKTEE
ncbi:hypothetical protein DFQ11_102614 [Winogradskyella epiphytica]|uniref:Glycerophosphoryl diester phosphodiesterase family protein n=1 Tax=Winogradskyella epiphytica TaxID=262005 RepID=A0A2V4XGR4_9FLAO|nr:hypothetical protein [Winogradskyella epiphytica]PYE82034.1 hypothetical protein DFQ11_102614 [Winogradskyella epiphytica]GGW60937.1 hypothetical protein GCM10008085_10600 [Winogradskyella epiphytica]